MFSISGSTRVYGIFGDPIAHTLSPLMQNATFQQYGVDAVYIPFHVKPRDLSNAVAGVKALGVAGINVTVPHKEKILPLLDQVDGTARMIGAVNTVVNQDGRLIGYNTDASGFMRSVQQEFQFSPRNKKILILGAGGASRAVAVALAENRVAHLTLANRTVQRAERLVHELGAHFSAVDFAATGYHDARFIDCLGNVDLIVNATSVGLRGEDINFLPLEDIKGGTLIYDMLYSLSETALIKKAKDCGLSAADGLGMLSAQGEDAFYLWTGIRPESGFMRRCLENSRS